MKITVVCWMKNAKFWSFVMKKGDKLYTVVIKFASKVLPFGGFNQLYTFDND